MSAPWAIVPVKALGQAKQRLAGVLPLQARRQLMLAMLSDVLATLARVEPLGPVLVVTPDAQVAELAQSSGARVLREVAVQGHTAAAMAGFAHAAAHGASRALTVPADAPFVTRSELLHLLDVAGSDASPRVVLAPARDGDGTNAVLVAPPDIFPPSFGPGSFARHLVTAEAQGLDCRVVELAGLGMDIDEPRDLLDLMARKRSDASYAFLWSESWPLRKTSVGADQS